MQQIPLQPLPNQSLSIQLDTNLWNFNIQEINGLMSIDFFLNDVPLLLGNKCLPNIPLIPYPALSQSGNFIFLTENDIYPYYPEFNTTQFLIYVSISEIQEVLNAG